MKSRYSVKYGDDPFALIPGHNWQYYGGSGLPSAINKKASPKMEQVFGKLVDNAPNVIDAEIIPPSTPMSSVASSAINQSNGPKAPNFLTAGLADLKNNFGWNSATGAKVFGKDLGGWKGIGTWGTGLYHGAKAIGNANEVTDSKNEAQDLLSDILRSSASNPLTNQFLTSDQTAMLNKIKRGTYDTESNFGDVDIMSLLGGAGKGALSGGLIAGIPGAIIGGLGGGLNANLERQNQDQQNINSQLEGLYQALMDAETQYNSMKRPNFTGLGIQSRYQNMYM